MSLCLNAQGNLQFNQVINLKPGDSYQVPSNKVLKIESISIQSNNLCMPRTGTQIVSCTGWGSRNEGIYAGFMYMTIGDLVYNVPSQLGRNLFPGQTVGCNTNPINPECYPINDIDLGSINVPIWLREGKQVIINNTSISVAISAIEFNVVP